MKKKSKGVEVHRDLLEMFLVDFVSDRTPRSRIHLSRENVKTWVTKYLQMHPGALSRAASQLPPTCEVEELVALLPDFWDYMKTQDPELLDRPTGMY